MRISLYFNDNDPRAMEVFRILDGAGHKKTELTIRMVEVIKEMFPSVMMQGFTSDDAAFLIKLLDYGARGLGQGVIDKPASVSNVRQAQPKHSKRSPAKKTVAKQTAPERPKLIEPIPAEPIPETPKPVSKPAPEPEVVTRPSDSAEETNTEDTPGAILAAILSPEDLAAAKKLQSKFSQLDDDFD